MDFLGRDTVSFSDDFWKKLDAQVVDTVRSNLIGRGFLSLFGPLGPGTIASILTILPLNKLNKMVLLRRMAAFYRTTPTS